jgi:hypothetical protein
MEFATMTLRHRLTIPAALLLLAIGGLCVAPVHAQGDGFPPQIDAVSVHLDDGASPCTGTLLASLTPCQEFATRDPTAAPIPVQEGDLLWICLTVTDLDLDTDDLTEDDGEQIEVSVISIWDQFRRGAIEYGPEPPPVPSDDDTFGYGPYTATMVNQTTITDIAIPFLVPEFNGVNQARLRGYINYDVRWFVEVQVGDSQRGEQQDGQGDPHVVRTFLDLCAVEDTALIPGNPPPIADAGPDQTVLLGSTVTLDGSRTLDRSNVGFDPLDPNVFLKDNLVFTWEWISGPPGSTALVPVTDPDDPSKATVTIACPVTDPDCSSFGDFPHYYRFRLLVEDQVNAMPSADDVVITVVEEILENSRPRADLRYRAPGDDRDLAELPEIVEGATLTVARGSTVELDASGSTDPDGDSLQYGFFWQQTNEVGGRLEPDELQDMFQALVGRRSDSVTWKANQTGTYFFGLYVQDPEGLSDTISFTVVVQNGGSTSLIRNGDVAGASDSSLTTPGGLCGAGLLPLAITPLLLWPMRRRWR